jgi:hypothetical protein
VQPHLWLAYGARRTSIGPSFEPLVSGSFIRRCICGTHGTICGLILEPLISNSPGRGTVCPSNRAFEGYLEQARPRLPLTPQIAC